jgi:hypothetical protein
LEQEISSSVRVGWRRSWRRCHLHKKTLGRHEAGEEDIQEGCCYPQELVDGGLPTVGYVAYVTKTRLDEQFWILAAEPPQQQQDPDPLTLQVIEAAVAA